MKNNRLNLYLVDSCKIKPSQDFLKEDTVRFIFECYQTGSLEKLPPPPIVRKDTDGSLVAIDGHNLLAVNCILGKQTEVFIAKDSDDKYPGESEAVLKRNIDLKEKFDSVLNIVDNLNSKGINSISDLIRYTKINHIKYNIN